MKKLILFFGIVILFISCGKSVGEQGFDLYQKGEYQAAIDLFDTYLKDHPQDANAFYNRGRAHEELENLEKAIADFKEASKLEPSEAAFWMSMGICNFKMKNYENTVSNMDAILQNNANNAEAYVLQGRAYSHLAEVKKAIDAFDAALKADERSGEAYLHRGRLKAAAGASGCSDLKKAQSLNASGAAQFIKKHCN